MNQTDPLALYSKATKPLPAQKSTQVHKPESPTYTYSQPTYNHRESSPQAAGCMTFLVGIVIIVVAIVIISGITVPVAIVRSCSNSTFILKHPFYFPIFYLYEYLIKQIF